MPQRSWAVVSNARRITADSRRADAQIGTAEHLWRRPIIAHSALTVTLILAATGLAMAEDYSLDPSICSGGQLISDDPAGLSIGNGTVMIRGYNCTRIGAKIPLRDGWFTANWDCSVEGEPSDMPPFALRLRGQTAEVLAEGERRVYQRCG